MRRLLLLAAVVLAACGDRGIEPPVAAAGDSADQVMKGMSFNVTTEGVKVSRVDAESAWVYNARQMNDLKKLKVTFYDKVTGKETSVVTADSGSYNKKDQTLDARGNVVATAANGKVLKSSHLVYDKVQNVIYSDTAYTFTSPDGAGSGASFTADPDFKQIRSQRMGGRAKGKGFVLPGQEDDKPAAKAPAPKPAAKGGGR
ncbi:MAG: LPS export ABC transporter periplasmic protein LptC [Gemmatimonadales bacterium]|jgi:LPS export ABC transporter protein LptC|nr:LPS export ABC transporter periplasmic protein LptC [Gemmatimonadales bacterium]MBP9898872.1 LPS export ABC transporter periplasmic protein LptC [Gemmatimonadales bacterium]